MLYMILNTHIQICCSFTIIWTFSEIISIRTSRTQTPSHPNHSHVPILSQLCILQIQVLNIHIPTIYTYFKIRRLKPVADPGPERTHSSTSPKSLFSFFTASRKIDVGSLSQVRWTASSHIRSTSAQTLFSGMRISSFPALTIHVATSGVTNRPAGRLS